MVIYSSSKSKVSTEDLAQQCCHVPREVLSSIPGNNNNKKKIKG